MQRRLPKKPNIENLRKRAKRLLLEFQSGDPQTTTEVKRRVDSRDLTLRQAQHVVARQYGFNTWADLAVFVSYRRGVGQVASRINWFWIPALDLDRAAAFHRNVLACDVWIHKEDGVSICSLGDFGLQAIVEDTEGIWSICTASPRPVPSWPIRSARPRFRAPERRQRVGWRMRSAAAPGARRH